MRPGPTRRPARSTRGARARRETLKAGEVYSQMGYVIFLAHREARHGVRCPANILDWRSHTCDRVCRSTFAAETMSRAEAFEAC
eukprot:2150746-Alexandrium_andersonii.AAC.1